MRKYLGLGVACLLAALPPTACGPGLFGGCGEDESGVLLSVSQESIGSGETKTFDVTSPRHSNFVVVVTWPDPAHDLQLRATDIECTGIRSACPYTSVGSREGVGGGPCRDCNTTPRRELTHDGTRGRRIRVSVIGDEVEPAEFNLKVEWLVSREC
jgi:hypothetical protein